jgi:hypothetical protein
MHSPKGVAIIPFVKDEQPYDDDDEGIAQNAEGGGGLMRRMMLLVTVALMLALTLAMSGAASAAPPHNVPNSGASHNCVASSSGVLFFREHGFHLGEEVRTAAPHGGQREWVQGALRETC